jgi:hypothetical protein
MASFVAAFANPFNYIGGVSFNPEKDIHDLSGKVALVTGGMFVLKFLKSTLYHQKRTKSLQKKFLTSSRKRWPRQRNHPSTFKTQAKQDLSGRTIGIKSHRGYQVH